MFKSVRSSLVGVVAWTVAGCTNAPDGPSATTGYLAGVSTEAETPVAEGTFVRTSERGVIVEERFDPNIDPEHLARRREQVREMVARDPGTDERAEPLVRARLVAAGDGLVQVTFNLPERGLPSVRDLAREDDLVRSRRIMDRQAEVARAQQPLIASPSAPSAASRRGRTRAGRTRRNASAARAPRQRSSPTIMASAIAMPSPAPYRTPWPGGPTWRTCHWVSSRWRPATARPIAAG